MNDQDGLQARFDALPFGMTRRQFGAASLGFGISLLLPGRANAVAVSERDVEIQTTEGTADCYFVYPAQGKAPGVLMWPDILGLRPAFRQMGKRLAEAGYAVLVINPFYRTVRAPVVQPGESFANEATRNKLMTLARALNPTTHLIDAKAFLTFLDAQPEVDTKRKLGTAGYCMGGPPAMRTAALAPDRVGAGASFHGSQITSDAPDSPHLLASQMRARFLFAIAEADDQQDPKSKDMLRETFGMAAEIEVYPDTRHGWCPPDGTVYNEVQANRAFARMVALFEEALV
ncbi:MAG: dienelactone hydrolase family protein [Gammaproteobacteria bacterium]|nr:dienelactone hydrolase family protein [Gammaproteobacteria bacterium]